MSDADGRAGPWRVLVADDEAPARAKLRRFLEQVPEVGSILEARDGPAALGILRDDAVDLVFLDIQMPGIDGLAVADAIARLPQASHLLVIFVTAHADRAVRAFVLSALDYLLKPWDGDRFAATIDRVRRTMQIRNDAEELAWHRRNVVHETAPSPLPDRLVIGERGVNGTRGTQQVIPTRAVIWIEADRNHVVLHGVDQQWRTRGPLAALAAAADLRSFRQVSRSAYVNLDAIVRVESIGHGDQQVHLVGGHVVRVSRRYPLRLS